MKADKWTAQQNAVYAGEDMIASVMINRSDRGFAADMETASDRAKLIAAAPDLIAGLRSIVERADNGDLGSSKVQDMRRIAVDLLAKHGGGA